MFFVGWCCRLGVLIIVGLVDFVWVGSSGFADFVRLFGLCFGVKFVLDVFCVVELMLIVFNSVVVFSFMLFPFVVLVGSFELMCLLICLRFARLAYWSLRLRVCGVVVYVAS